MSDTPNGGPVVAAPAKKRPMSFTAIDTYTRCPGFYETRYVQRRKFPASDAQLLGTIVHAAAELYANQRGDVTPEQAFDTVVAREGLLSFAGYAEAKDLVGYACAGIDFDRLIAVEQSFVIPIGDIEVTGLIDRALRLNEDTMEAEDLKTAIVPKSQWEMEQDLQLAIYYTACRALFPTMPNVILSLVWVRHGCKSTITFRDDIIESVYGYLRQVCDRIEAKVFDPQLNMYCAWCPVKSECRAYCDLGAAAQAAIDAPVTTQAELFEKFNMLRGLSKVVDGAKSELQAQALACMNAAGSKVVEAGENDYKSTFRVNEDFDCNLVGKTLQAVGANPFGVMSVQSTALKALLPSLRTKRPDIDDLIAMASRKKPTASWIDVRKRTKKKAAKK